METLINRIFLHNWQRKLIALLFAVFIWFFINHSITEVKTIPNVPIRIINIPSDKTIAGLLPNGVLTKRITLTLSGTKNVIDQLESGDLEVLLDASTANQEDWIVQITKKNLVSLNPSIDLLHHVTQVFHHDFVIRLSRLLTKKIPVSIETPIGTPPLGYEFLNISPQNLFQTVSGPEEQVQKLAEQGFELTFDLKDISQADLDALKPPSQEQHSDEVSFLVPRKWKQVTVPCHSMGSEELNDPEAQNLRIDFLKKEYLPLNKEIPLQIFFPSLDEVNPEMVKMIPGEYVKFRNGLPYLAMNLYTYDVSRLFLDVVRNYLQIVIIASPQSERDPLHWSVEFINLKELEDTYVAFSIANSTHAKSNSFSIPKKKEEILRKRFRDYMNRFTLYVAPNEKLRLNFHWEGHQIIFKAL